MILKSMGVECNKNDMDNYAGEVDEEETGKFSFVQFCSVRIRGSVGGGWSEEVARWHRLLGTAPT